MRVLSLVSNQTVMGAGKVVMEFCTQASQVGVECIPVCMIRGQRQTSEYAEALAEVGIRCERLYERHSFDLRGPLQMASIIRRLRPDIVEAHGNRETFYLLFLQHFLPFTAVVYFHGWTEANRWTREDSVFSASLLRYCPRLITVCENFRQRMMRQGVPASRIHVVYNAINPDLCYAVPAGDARRELNIREGVPVVSVIGRLSGEKGQANFLRAFALVAQARPDAKALIVGEGLDGPPLKQLARDLRLDSRVVFTGYQRDVRKFYEASSVLVVPSKSEGVPNVVLEAMVFGVPIVSTRVGGIPEVIEDGHDALLVPSQDPARLADAIVKVLADPQAASRLARAAREKAATKFSNLTRCSGIAGLYRQFLASVSPRPVHSSRSVC